MKKITIPKLANEKPLNNMTKVKGHKWFMNEKTNNVMQVRKPSKS